MAVVDQVQDSTFNDDVLKSEQPVLVDLWAEWCAPCKMIEPVLHELADELEGKLKVCRLNVDENRATAARFGVQSIPTLLFFKDGQLVGQHIGFAQKSVLLERVEAFTGVTA